MRIIALENHPSTQEGGQELSFYDLLKGLHGKGHEIVLLYVKEGDLLERYRAFCADTIRVNGYRASASRPIGSILDIVRDISRVSAAGPTVVYANQYLDAFFAAGLSLKLRCPFVCHLRLPPSDRFSRQYRLGLRRASKLIAVSAQTRSEYVEQDFDPARIRVVHNGIDSARFKGRDAAAERRRAGLPETGYLITYAGRLHPAKGLETLIEAFSLMRRREEGDRLVIAGDVSDHILFNGGQRDYRAELEAYAERKGVADDIAWIKHCADIPGLFTASDIVVVPSLWPEPFGRTLIEAMACGVPALGSAVGGIPEILTGSFKRFLFDAGIVSDLAALIESMRGWKQKEPALADECRAHVERHFTIAKTVDGVEAVLKELVP